MVQGKKRNTYVAKIKILAHIIDCIARYCWMGLPALQGDAKMPQKEDIFTAIFYKPLPASERRAGAPLVPRDFRQCEEWVATYEPVLKEASWPRIVRAVKLYKTLHKGLWDVYVDYLLQSSTTSIRVQPQKRAERDIFMIDNPVSAKGIIARQYGISDKTVQRIVKNVPWEIAKTVNFICTVCTKPGAGERRDP